VSGTVDDEPGPEETGDWAAAAIEDEFDEFQAADLDQRFPWLGPYEYVLMRPSEETEVVSGLPEPTRDEKWIAFRPGEIVLADGRRLSAYPIGAELGTAELSGPPVTLVALVTIEASSRRWRWRGARRYLIAASADNELLAWIDHSPPSWDFRPGQISQIARLTKVKAAVEHYRTEDKFSAAHPAWIA